MLRLGGLRRVTVFRQVSLRDTISSYVPYPRLASGVKHLPLVGVVVPSALVLTHHPSANRVRLARWREDYVGIGGTGRGWERIGENRKEWEVMGI